MKADFKKNKELRWLSKRSHHRKKLNLPSSRILLPTTKNRIILYYLSNKRSLHVIYRTLPDLWWWLVRIHGLFVSSERFDFCPKE